MDDPTLNHSLKDTLTNHAQTVIPDDYDRWSYIQEALLEEEDPMKLQHLRVAPRNPRRTRRLITVLAAALLLTTTAVYAVYQSTLPYTDPGIEGVEREGYTTNLNLVQRVGDVEVQLNWGYVDTSRVLLNLQVFAIQPDGTRTSQHHLNLYKIQLRNSEAVLPEFVHPYGIGRPTTDPGLIIYDYVDEPQPDAMPDNLNFTLELMVGKPKFSVLRFLEYIALTFMPSYLPIQPFRQQALEMMFQYPFQLTSPEATPDPEFETAPMRFDFTLPVQKTLLLEPQESVEVNGTVGTLSLISAPSRTFVRTCFQVPPTQDTWFPDLEVTIDGRPAEWTGGERYVPPQENGLDCTELEFNGFTQPGTILNVNVSSIQRVPSERPLDDPARLLELQQLLGDRGFIMAVEVQNGQLYGFDFTDQDKPGFNEALVELGYRIEGPWEFTIEIPEQ